MIDKGSAEALRGYGWSLVGLEGPIVEVEVPVPLRPFDNCGIGPQRDFERGQDVHMADDLKEIRPDGADIIDKVGPPEGGDRAVIRPGIGGEVALDLERRVDNRGIIPQRPGQGRDIREGFIDLVLFAAAGLDSDRERH